jgi:8-oxo-dGTP diphosphatase
MSEKTNPAPTRKVTAAVIEKEGKVFVARRRPELRFGGLWEFPGGKLEDGEEPEQGLERELAEEFGIQAVVGERFCVVTYRSQTLAVELLVYRAAHVSGDFHPVDHDETRWLSPGEMEETMFAMPDRPVVRMLRARSAGAGEDPPWTA